MRADRKRTARGDEPARRSQSVEQEGVERRVGVGAAGHDLGQGLAAEPDAERLVAPDVLAVDGVEPQAKGQQHDEQHPQVGSSSVCSVTATVMEAVYHNRELAIRQICSREQPLAGRPGAVANRGG